MYELRKSAKEYKCLICHEIIPKKSLYIRWRTYGGDFKMHRKCHVWSSENDKDVAKWYDKWYGKKHGINVPK